METIVVGRCDAYEAQQIKAFLQNGFEQTGFVARQHKVLLKPNLLAGKPPEKAVTTHPQFIKAVAEVFLDLECEVSVGDSPGFESTERVLQKSGIREVIDALGLRVASFDKKVERRFHGVGPFKTFVLGEDPASYDVIVNLPKLKTHSMMGMTLGVKNTFGFIHSLGKARWHLMAGRDKMLFAAILIDLHLLVSPAITILDGIVGMDKDGPSSGRARKTGIIAFSRNAFVLDRYIETLIGLPSPLPISSLAAAHGLVPDYKVLCEDTPVISDFQMPKAGEIDWILPGFVRRRLKDLLVRKPKVLKGLCTGCGTCAMVCPTKAMTSGQGLPTLNPKECIRCYCCQEMCPENAITV